MRPQLTSSPGHADLRSVELALASRRFLLAVTAAVLVTALFAAWIGLQIGGAETTLWMDDLVTPLAAGVGCVLCFRASARHHGAMRRFWLLFGCAMASWTLAEVIWGVYALILSEEVPVPSWADFGYLGAIPLAVAALVVHPATRGSRTRKARTVLDGLVVATALLFLSWTLVLGPLWRGSDLTTWSGVVAVAYPFGDIVIVFFIVLAIRGMTGAQRLSLWCLLAGLLAMALSDSTYTYLTEVTSYSSTSANWIDTGWVAAYLGIALAAFSSRVGDPDLHHVGFSRPALASRISPLLPVLIALSAAAVEIKLGDHLDHAALLMALGLIGLVLARQALLVRELLAPEPGTRADLRARLKRAGIDGALAADGPAPHYRSPSRARL
jgi:hypothetical protein